MSTRIPNLGITKALKLLYIIDETSFKRTGVPVTWLDYKVWEMGPVAEEIHNEIQYGKSLVQNNTSVSLAPFIEVKKDNLNGFSTTVLLPKGKFDLADFTAFELELIDNVIDRHGSSTSKQLIEMLHEQDTLWHKCVSDKGLALNFKLYGKKSNHSIDFSELIKNDPILQMSAEAAYESMELQETLENL